MHHLHYQNIISVIKYNCINVSYYLYWTRLKVFVQIKFTISAYIVLLILHPFRPLVQFLKMHWYKTILTRLKPCSKQDLTSLLLNLQLWLNLLIVRYFCKNMSVWRCCFSVALFNYNHVGKYNYYSIALCRHISYLVTKLWQC